MQKTITYSFLKHLKFSNNIKGIVFFLHRFDRDRAICFFITKVRPILMTFQLNKVNTSLKNIKSKLKWTEVDHADSNVNSNMTISTNFLISRIHTYLIWRKEIILLRYGGLIWKTQIASKMYILLLWFNINLINQFFYEPREK